MDSARASELLPLGEVLAVLIEDLNSVVAAVAHEEPSLGIEGQGVRHLELPGTGAMTLAPC